MNEPRDRYAETDYSEGLDEDLPEDAPGVFIPRQAEAPRRPSTARSLLEKRDEERWLQEQLRDLADEDLWK